MTARVDKDLCIGCGLCVSTCPEVFKMEEDKAIVIVSTVPKAAEDCCKKATEECPVTAIIIE
ncbi:MAG: ferredoxin [Candidatus Omnitrophica bacterium]|nr:ferredoxin [Candidatus Omnitrophota bacterium]